MIFRTPVQDGQSPSQTNPSTACGRASAQAGIGSSTYIKTPLNTV